MSLLVCVNWRARYEDPAIVNELQCSRQSSYRGLVAGAKAVGDVVWPMLQSYHSRSLVFHLSFLCMQSICIDACLSGQRHGLVTQSRRCLITISGVFCHRRRAMRQVDGSSLTQESLTALWDTSLAWQSRSRIGLHREVQIGCTARSCWIALTKCGHLEGFPLGERRTHEPFQAMAIYWLRMQFDFIL